MSECTLTHVPTGEWRFAAFGLNASSDEADNGFCRHDDGSVSLWSLHNCGKLNLPSTDGLAFYYFPVPADCGFSLTARACLVDWAFTNGQEGFGLMAADRVGRHGEDRSFWNNSCMAACARVEYRLDPETGAVVSDRQYPLISMKLGIGAQIKTGVTPDNLPELEAGSANAVMKWVSSRMFPLETSCAEYGGGSYNLFGNEQTGRVVGTVAQPLTEVTLRICRTSSGFEVNWLDETGTIQGLHRFPNRDALCALDRDFIYVGMFAARSCCVTFRDVSLRIFRDSPGLPDASVEVEQVSPTCRILSSRYSNHAVYMLRCLPNADGTLRIFRRGRPKEENVLTVTSGTPASCRILLEEGENALQLRFEPTKGFRHADELGAYQVVHRVLERNFTVSFVPLNGRSTLYAAPDGTPGGAATRESPVDIHTAIACASPGCEILLMEGWYRPGRSIVIDRDVSGIEGSPIHLHAEGNGRAVFDFEKRSAGFVFAGSYWEIDHIDCLNTADFTPGIALCGHDIHLHHAGACGNGDAGIVAWTLLDTDTRDDWPHDIQVTHCISCNNADPGATNADGFAAKLTVGPGIVFDHCISCFNADDGFDLFTKVELGTTSPVVIKNCVSFRNGFDSSGRPRGYGDGIKLGGTSLPGGHYLYNCISWGNRGRGISSNSAPNEHIKGCTSFDNEGANVALYTRDAKDTDYRVSGLCSLRTEHQGAADDLCPKGSQDEAFLFGKRNFYWGDGQSCNAEGLVFRLSWLESLDPPQPDPERLPWALGELMDKEGKIHLGRFLKLNDRGESALRRAGLNPTDIVAHLHGNC